MAVHLQENREKAHQQQQLKQDMFGARGREAVLNRRCGELAEDLKRMKGLMDLHAKEADSWGDRLRNFERGRCL